MSNAKHPESREVELVHPSYQPSKPELEEPIEFPEGTTPDDLARAVMQPVKERHVKRPKQER